MLSVGEATEGSCRHVRVSGLRAARELALLTVGLVVDPYLVEVTMYFKPLVVGRMSPLEPVGESTPPGVGVVGSGSLQGPLGIKPVVRHRRDVAVVGTEATSLGCPFSEQSEGGRHHLPLQGQAIEGAAGRVARVHPRTTVVFNHGVVVVGHRLVATAWTHAHVVLGPGSSAALVPVQFVPPAHEFRAAPTLVCAEGVVGRVLEGLNVHVGATAVDSPGPRAELPGDPGHEAETAVPPPILGEGAHEGLVARDVRGDTRGLLVRVEAAV